MATMDITEIGFQTPACKKRKASGSPSLPPASQPTTSPSTYKNKTPLIATGIDPKFKTPIQIMSELRQYHPSLRVLQIKQTKNGWAFIGDTPKDFNILQSKAKMKQAFGPKVKVTLPRSYHSADASVVYSSDFTFNKFCVRIFPSKLTHVRDPLLIPFKIRTQNLLKVKSMRATPYSFPIGCFLLKRGTQQGDQKMRMTESRMCQHKSNL